LDLLVHDASLLPEEAAEAPFGHAVADYAVRLGELAGARRVLLAHHKHDRTDDALNRLASRLTAASAGVILAAEGGIFDL
jgi:ribonuclease BN (tRNA processing enzyme)